MQKDELIKTLTQKKDPRSVKWENKVILDTLQELQSSQVSDLLKAVNDTFECEPPLLTYNQLYSHLKGLLVDGIVNVNPITKQYSVKPEYITVIEHTEYLPISNYCVMLFAVSLMGLVIASIAGVMVAQAAGLVIAGGLYLFAQLVGSEFDYEERKGTAMMA